MSKDTYKEIAYNLVPREDSLADSNRRKRGQERRRYPYVPGAFALTELSADPNGRRSVELQRQGRSLVSERDVKRTLGFPGRVLGAVSMGQDERQETFWVVDVRGSVKPKAQNSYSRSPRTSYNVRHPSGEEVNLGESGIVIVQPRAWQTGDTRKPGFLRLAPAKDRPYLWSALVNGRAENTTLPNGTAHGPARNELDLSRTFPQNGFLVTVRTDQANTVAVSLLNPRNDANPDERIADVLEPLPETPRGLLAHAVGALAMSAIK